MHTMTASRRMRAATPGLAGGAAGTRRQVDRLRLRCVDAPSASACAARSGVRSNGTVSAYSRLHSVTAARWRRTLHQAQRGEQPSVRPPATLTSAVACASANVRTAAKQGQVTLRLRCGPAPTCPGCPWPAQTSQRCRAPRPAAPTGPAACTSTGNMAARGVLLVRACVCVKGAKLAA